MKNTFPLIAAFFISVLFTGGIKEQLPYKDTSLTIEERIEDLLSRMTREEKIAMLGGTGFETKAIERLGIPPMNMTDGPVGVRWGNSSSFPSGISLAATWDTSLAGMYGSALAKETKGKGRHVILGPCVNIARIPQGGRNFESFGEDPYLTSRIAVNYIKGVQKENVAATIKHYACNNQEFQRDFVDVKIDERALNEIYLPSFKAAVREAGVLAVMSAYNKVNGFYCSENEYLLEKKLKEEWGFKGLVMSDWGAVHSTIPTLENGLDLEMPTGFYLNDSSVTQDVDESLLDNKVGRILRVMFKIGLFDPAVQNEKPDTTIFYSKEHKNLAYEVARQSIVLLKNENNILPINKEKIKSIAVIGPNAKIARTGGGGSSYVDPIYSVPPLEALKNKLGDKTEINFAEGVRLGGDTKPIEEQFFVGGVKAQFFRNMDLKGEAIEKTYSQLNFDWGGEAPFEKFPEDNFSVKFTADIKAPKSGDYEINVTSDDGVRMYFEGKQVISDWNDHAAFTNAYKVNLREGKVYRIVVDYYERGGSASIKLGWRLPGEDPFKSALEAAKKSDIALLFVGTSNSYESEGFDRNDLILPANQEELIEEVSKVNDNVVVVLNSGSPVLMDNWISKADGIIEIWFGGEETGNAAADVLLGNYNPSGKLPVTFPKSWEDCSAYKTYKAKDGVTDYSDGIFVGYRHFDKYKIEPLFPFGYGLSYTNFEYSSLKTEGNKISFDLKNSGRIDGSEVVQLYVKDSQCSVERPEKELKGFEKVTLKPGETRKINFTLEQDELSFFDPSSGKWKFEPGVFKVMIGSSSRDIRLQKEISLD